MSDNENIIDSKDFMSYMKKMETEKNKPCFLVGNGLVRYLQTSDWNNVIRKVIRRAISEGNGFSRELSGYLCNIKDTSVAFNHTEIYTSLLLNKAISKSKDSCVKKYLKEILENPSCAFLNYALHHKSQILTTNFDYTIERALKFSKDEKGCFFFSNVKGLPNSDVYASYGEYVMKTQHKDMYLEKTTAGDGNTGHYVTDNCAVWHIQGVIHRSPSIMFGFEDYVNAFLNLKKWQLHSGEDGKSYAEPWKDTFSLKNSWLRLFFTRPLVIVGCGLNSEEIFLRWLLVRRQRETTLPDKASIPGATYYLTTQKGSNEQDEGKFLFFKSLGIKVVQFKDYVELYDGVQWKSESSNSASENNDSVKQGEATKKNKKTKVL